MAIRIDVHPTGKTRYTWHICFPHQSMYTPRMLPAGSPRTWQPFASHKQRCIIFVDLETCRTSNEEQISFGSKVWFKSNKFWKISDGANRSIVTELLTSNLNSLISDFWFQTLMTWFALTLWHNCKLSDLIKVSIIRGVTTLPLKKSRSKIFEGGAHEMMKDALTA
jgi:hypothetical protein